LDEVTIWQYLSIGYLDDFINFSRMSLYKVVEDKEADESNLL